MHAAWSNEMVAKKGRSSVKHEESLRDARDGAGEILHEAPRIRASQF